MTPATILTNEILLAISEQFPNVIVWRNNRIVATVAGRDGRPRRIDAGIDGQGDICGIIGPHGRGLQIEIKSGRDKMRESQVRFAAMWTAQGGVYIEARSVEQCVRELRERLA